MTHNNSKKIAVVAVHGVSDQKPFESARAIANLLLDPTTNKKANYTPFYERFFRIAVRPAKVKNTELNYGKFSTNNQESSNIIKWFYKLKNKFLSFFPNERGSIIHKRLRTPLDELDSASFDDVDLDFTRDRLKSYHKSTVYNSVRLESERFVEGEAKKVHVYEMHWADLSRLGTGFVHIFGELFQLLFHLSSLGRPIIDSIRVKIRETPQLCNESLDNQLKCWGRLQICTSLIISLIIPILNLYLLVAAFLSVPVANIPAEYLSITVQVSTGIILAILTQKLIIDKTSLPFRIAFVLPVIIGVGSAYLLDPLLTAADWGYYHLITIIWGFLLMGVCWVVLIKPFDRYRPGSKRFVAIAGTLLLPCILYLLQTADSSPEGLTNVSLNLIEIIYPFLSLAWLSFNLMYFMTMLSGLIVYVFLKLPQSPDQISSPTSWSFKKTFFRLKEILVNFKQAFLITQLTLILPAILFLFLTLTLWQALANLSDSLLLETKFYQPLIFSPDQKFIPYNFLKQLTIFSSSSPVANPVSLIVVTILIIMGWFTFTSNFDGY